MAKFVKKNDKPFVKTILWIEQKAEGKKDERKRIQLMNTTLDEVMAMLERDFKESK